MWGGEVVRQQREVGVPEAFCAGEGAVEALVHEQQAQIGIVLVVFRGEHLENHLYLHNGRYVSPFFTHDLYCLIVHE